MVSQTLGMLASTENAEDLQALGDLFVSGQVTPAIDRAYPLSETAEAIRYVRNGHARGKVVITVGDP
jgi:NADPH:quinone reductase-like Zn-dependent oxidoreductase